MSKVLLGDVAAERRETCKGSKDGYPTVGLEHLTPEEITLASWDDSSGNTFTKIFHKGDVLFGRRRAYLKKAAVAPFDGICSGDITVITAKPNFLLPELLPFIIQNDALFDFAVEKSAGSLSPRVKWEHLKNYEFSLPDMEKQHELSELLWAMDATKKSYQRLLATTDELVNEDIYEPDYSDVLRVAFTYKFSRGRLSDLVSLLSSRDFEARDFKAEIAERAFHDLHDAVLDVANQAHFQRHVMILKSVGVERASQVRSQNVLNFGYILYLTLKAREIDSNMIERIVRRRIVLTILTGRYSGSPESAFDYDVKRFNAYENPLEYLEQAEVGELSDAFWNNVLVDRLNTSVAGSPYFNVFLMAQVKNHDKGFLGEHIEVKAMLEERGDIHHLLPKKYLIQNGVSSKGQYNQIAN